MAALDYNNRSIKGEVTREEARVLAGELSRLGVLIKAVEFDLRKLVKGEEL